MQSFFQQFWEKVPSQSWEKMIDLTVKLGEIDDIEHNKGSKIYPQSQAILDCIMPTIPLKRKYVFKYHSDMCHCFSFFFILVEVVSKTKAKKNIFFFYFS